MGFRITLPGKFRLRWGGSAEAFVLRDGWWYGRREDQDSGWRPESWRESDGRCSGVSEEPHDIVSVWTDEPLPKPADNRPDPGEGWRLIGDAEPLEIGDEFLSARGEWITWSPGYAGESPSECKEKYALRITPTRRRIPETWTLTPRERDRVLNRDAGGPIPDGAFWSYRGGESKLVVREQCWTCGDREEWRVPEVRS